MKVLKSFFVWLELVGLGVWVGGMLTLGGLVAPIVFGKIKPVELAGEAMSVVFRRFNGGLVYGCIVLVVLGFIGKGWLTRSRGIRYWIETGLVTALVVSGLYIGAILGPKMETLREANLINRSNGMAIAKFDYLHRESELLFSVNIFLGLAVLWMNTRSSPADGREER